MSPPALEHLCVPERLERGRPWRQGGLRGRAYAPVPPELEAALPRWLGALAVPEGLALKPPDVFRVGALVVKLFRRPSLFGWFRPPRAVRSAERHFWCQPLRSPRPWIAAGRGLGDPSVLVREHVEGALLPEVWAAHDARAEGALAQFLAALERSGTAHGDLHPRNLLWDGREWVLLDPDGLRHGLHDPRRVAVGQWARLLLHLPDAARIEALFRASTAAARTPIEWSRVLAAAERLRARREQTLAREARSP